MGQTPVFSGSCSFFAGSFEAPCEARKENAATHKVICWTLKVKK